MYISSLLIVLIVLQNDFCKFIVWLLYSVKVFLLNVGGKGSL